MLSTASMVRIGKTYQNLMVDMVASNEKLAARAVSIVVEATGCTNKVAVEALEKTQMNLKLAILIVLTGKTVAEAHQDLDSASGFLRRALRNEQ
jgi:N-acetylmuramic acid 6-phosphate etherase